MSLMPSHDCFKLRLSYLCHVLLALLVVHIEPVQLLHVFWHGATGVCCAQSMCIVWLSFTTTVHFAPLVCMLAAILSMKLT
jgi:hypothetical protein